MTYKYVYLLQCPVHDIYIRDTKKTPLDNMRKKHIKDGCMYVEDIIIVEAPFVG